MKILLLEDDKYLCGNIKQQLTKEGYIVDACNDGEEGFLLALDQGNSYDLAVIDRMLPVIDGLAIIKAMRNKKIQIPVIIITGMSELQDKIEGLDNGLRGSNLYKRFGKRMQTWNQRIWITTSIFYENASALSEVNVSWPLSTAPDLYWR